MSYTILSINDIYGSHSESFINERRCAVHSGNTLFILFHYGKLQNSYTNFYISKNCAVSVVLAFSLHVFLLQINVTVNLPHVVTAYKNQCIKYVNIFITLDWLKIRKFLIPQFDHLFYLLVFLKNIITRVASKIWI